MINVKFDFIDDYDDVGMINYYCIQCEKGDIYDEIMKVIWEIGCDNLRMLMQWNIERNVGFFIGIFWMKVNLNYVDINVEEQKSDENLVLNFYKQFIKIRKQYDVLVYGIYKLLVEEDFVIYVYM